VGLNVSGIEFLVRTYLSFMCIIITPIDSVEIMAPLAITTLIFERIISLGK